MVVVLLIVPTMQIAGHGCQRCARSVVFWPATTGCVTWLRVNCKQVLRRPPEPARGRQELRADREGVEVRCWHCVPCF
jgi:hypothetical protein